jgi:hypothetical protein
LWIAWGKITLDRLTHRFHILGTGHGNFRFRAGSVVARNKNEG